MYCGTTKMDQGVQRGLQIIAHILLFSLSSAWMLNACLLNSRTKLRSTIGYHTVQRVQTLHPAIPVLLKVFLGSSGSQATKWTHVQLLLTVGVSFGVPYLRFSIQGECWGISCFSIYRQLTWSLYVAEGGLRSSGKASYALLVSAWLLNSKTAIFRRECLALLL